MLQAQSEYITIAGGVSSKYILVSIAPVVPLWVSEPLDFLVSSTDNMEGYWQFALMIILTWGLLDALLISIVAWTLKLL